MQCNTALQKHNLRWQISAFLFIMCDQNSHYVDPFSTFVRKTDLFLLEICQSFGCSVPIIQIFHNINDLVFLFHLYESALLPIVTIASSRLLTAEQ